MFRDELQKTSFNPSFTRGIEMNGGASGLLPAQSDSELEELRQENLKLRV